jgi:uncharacterized protein (DUF488 family)
VGFNMNRPFFTVGHSTRTFGAFVDLVNASGIELIVDVRTIPRSRANPQFDSAALARQLPQWKIDYEHIASLGGLRARNYQVPAHVNEFWKNQSFHNYADYALSEDFRCGLTRLRTIGHAAVCAIMCAEAVWWRCHRRIIVDYLIAAGETVFHILGSGRVQKAHITSAARLEPSGAVIYPRGA